MVSIGTYANKKSWKFFERTSHKILGMVTKFQYKRNRVIQRFLKKCRRISCELFVLIFIRIGLIFWAKKVQAVNTHIFLKKITKLLKKIAMEIKIFCLLWCLQITWFLTAISFWCEVFWTKVSFLISAWHLSLPPKA